MNKNRTRMIFIMMLVFLGLLVFAAVFMPGASAKTINVDDSGGKDYMKIQDAINVANPGDTVYVYNGTYNEQITISKSISLTGESNQHTIIKGTGDYDSMGIYIATNYVNVSNIKIDNFDTGIRLGSGSNNNIIASNTITNSGMYGIDLRSSNNVISRNTITNSDLDGIMFYFCSSNAVSSNTITNNGRHGIYLDGSNNNIATNNIYNNKQYGLYLFSSAGTGNTAINNWWGSASGPYNAASNPTGKGDEISNGITFSPWATSLFDISKPTIKEEKKESKSFIPGFETILLIASISCMLLFRKHRRIK
ncbi:MAG: right-handed parallel beta-helix repeat-containing protein [Thermoplasmata archaeon]